MPKKDRYSRFMRAVLSRRNSDPGIVSARPAVADGAKSKKASRAAPVAEPENLFEATNSAVRRITDRASEDRSRSTRRGQLARSLSDTESVEYAGKSYPDVMQAILDRDVHKALGAHTDKKSGKKPSQLKGRRFETPWGPVTITPKRLNNQYMVSTKAKDYPASSRGRWAAYQHWAKVLRGNEALKAQVAEVMRDGGVAVERKRPRATWTDDERRAAASLYATIAVAEEHRIPGTRLLGMEALRSPKDIDSILAGRSPLFPMAGTGGTALTRGIAAHRVAAPSADLGEQLFAEYGADSDSAAESADEEEEDAYTSTDGDEESGDAADDEFFDDDDGDDEKGAGDYSKDRLVAKAYAPSSAAVPPGVAHIEGLNFQPAPGDGSCLYHAVGLYLGKSEADLREEVAHYIETHADETLDIIAALPENEEEGLDPAEYAESIREGRWADDLEIQILMNIYHRPIVVVGPEGTIRNPLAIQAYAEANPIFVYYNGEDHYDALLLVPGANPQEIMAELGAGAMAAGAAADAHPEVLAGERAPSASGTYCFPTTGVTASHLVSAAIGEASTLDEQVRAGRKRSRYVSPTPHPSDGKRARKAGGTQARSLAGSDDLTSGAAGESHALAGKHYEAGMMRDGDEEEEALDYDSERLDGEDDEDDGHYSND